MKPSLVFMSPVIPSFSGNGLAMRAAHNLRALSESFLVHLLIIRMYRDRDDAPGHDVVACCASWKLTDAPINQHMSLRRGVRNLIRWGTLRPPPEWSAWDADSEAAVACYLKETSCRRIWVFRFYLLPWGKAWLDHGGSAWLDLDELESSSRLRQARLLFDLGQHAMARRMSTQARAYRHLEERFLRRFERIMTASEIENERLRAQIGDLPAESWPNIVSLPREDLKPAAHERWHLLFVGSMGHLPNRAAVHYAAREILPRLQRMAERRVVLRVAGAGGTDADFADLKDVEWLGMVPDLLPLYADTDLVIVPLQAAGGTRIKILEALAHRKAVVSTRIGAEGLNVHHGEELYIVDTPDEMAAGCAELLRDAERRDRMAASGYAYVRAHHQAEHLKIRAAALAQDIKPSSAK
jgi:glycosyltransferase involved in cell wall biosynthesis